MSADYAIEWIYGEFRIARFANDGVAESWSSPTEVRDLESLVDAMHEASFQIDLSRGGNVAIAYEDDLHTHQFLEVPHLSRKELEKYLLRRVEQDKPFDGPAAWSYHGADRGGGLDGVLLHLMPRHVVDAVLRICGEYYLAPKRLVPLTEVISEHVPEYGEPAEASLLSIALFQARTQILVSKGNGEVLFVRELTYAWCPETEERLLTDINRTIGYAKQRIGGGIHSAWLMGENANAAAASIDAGVSVPLRVDDMATDPNFWMTEVSLLPTKLDSNFIPPLARKSINSKTLMRAGVMIAAVLVIAAGIVTVTMESLLHLHRVNELALFAEIHEMEDEVLRLEAQLERAASAQDRLDQLSVDSFNLPALFLSHLGNLVPHGVVLMEAEVNQIDSAWQVTLKGKSQQSLADSTPILAALERGLEEAPWNTTIVQSWDVVWMEQLRTGQAAASGDIGFEIRGQFR